MAKIAIYGANGYAGDAIWTEAERRGHEVSGFSRSGTPREGSQHTDLATGDVHDADAVRKVAEDVDVVVVAIHAGPENGVGLLDAIPALLQISADTGTRLAIVGGAGSLRSTEDGPLHMHSEGFPAIALGEATSHGEVLDALRASDIGEWFYLSPAIEFGAHAPQEALGRYLTGGDVVVRDSRGRSALSAEDYALALVDEIENGAHRNTRFAVAGAY